MKNLLISLTLFVMCLSFVYSDKEKEQPKKNKIKYELSVTTPSYNYEKSIYTRKVVKSQRHAFSITILNDVPELRKGMLQIKPNTYYFWMSHRSLEVIEPGTFDNQNITEEIRLSGNKLTVIKSETFKGLRIKKLDLSYNKITHLEENAIIDLPELWEVHFGWNEIVEFGANIFVNTPKVSTFEIIHNKIEKFGENCFSFMTNESVAILAASENEISEIDPTAFEGVNFWNLDLSHNKLKNLSEEVFSQNELVFLHLKNNELTSLPDTFFQQKNLTDVDLRENPLECDVQKKLKELSERNRLFYIFYNTTNC